MRSNGIRLYTFFVIFCISGALIIRFASVLRGSETLNAVFGVLVLLGIGINTYQGLMTDGAELGEIGRLYGTNFRLDFFAQIAAAGFFIHFISQAVLLFKGVTGRRTEAHFVVAIAVSAVLSLMCCVYFTVVRMTYSKRNYDFRELYFFHLVPLFWSLSEVFSVIADSGEFDRDTDSLLKYATLIFMTLFFFCFARDMDRGEEIKRTTLLFARLFSYLSMLYFFDRLMLLLFGKVSLSDNDNFLALAGIMICGFVFFFEKDAYNKKSISNSSEH